MENIILHAHANKKILQNAMDNKKLQRIRQEMCTL